MLAKRIIASAMAVIIAMTMSCCASIFTETAPATSSHACCDKDKEKGKKKSEEKQHNCQCGEKLVQLSEKHTHHAPFIAAAYQATEALDLFTFTNLTFSKAYLSSSPPQAPPLRHLLCTYLI